MRSRRFSYVVGGTAVALLAIAGFAAFGSPDPTTQEIRVEAAAASMGHTTGAYAGVAFAFLTAGSDDGATTSQGLSPTQPDPLATAVNPTSTEDPTEPAVDPSAGTIASPTAGWLSEVEVRALVSLYFEAEDVNQAVRVAWCESRFDPDSIDRKTGGVGLFHHLPRYWAERATSAGFPGAEPTDAEASVAAAAWAVYDGGGWDVFGCRG